MLDKTENTNTVKLVGDDTRYLVHHMQEILRIFRGLILRRELVSAFFNNGEDLLLTVVLDIDPTNNTLILDYGSNEVLNQRLLEAERVVFVSAIDLVKVKFASQALRRGVFDGRPAFLMEIPQEVLQLQRREYYRLKTPIAHPLWCKVPLPDQQIVDIVILDISAGGIGTLVEEGVAINLEVGELLRGCSIVIPDIVTLEVTLSVRNIFEVTLKNGRMAKRCNCAFVGLNPALQSTIQRYNVMLQRERIANTLVR
jgi:c-di-GMP-binding flagellar brake protein YcgR